MPAFIIGIVEDTRQIPDDDPKQSWNHGTISLDLADCYRRVSFNFDMYDEAERANSLRKITLIAEVVNAVREAIALEVESINARPVETDPVKIEEDSRGKTEPVNTEADTRAQFFTSQITTLGL